MEQLSARQRELIDESLPGAEVMTDHSSGLVGTTVLELSHDGGRYIVEVGDEPFEQQGHRMIAEALADED